MSFDEATIMAYVDGECDAVTVNRIEKAMETDPALARQIEQAQALRNKLSAHYDPVVFCGIQCQQQFHRTQNRTGRKQATAPQHGYCPMGRNSGDFGSGGRDRPIRAGGRL